MKYLIFLCPICLLNNFLSFQLFVFSALWSSQSDQSDILGEYSWMEAYMFPVTRRVMYRVVFLTGPPDFLYQNEKQVAANQD